MQNFTYHPNQKRIFSKRRLYLSVAKEMAWKTTVDALSFETKHAEVINLQKETLHITVQLYYLLIDSTTLNFILLKHHLLKNKNQIKLIKVLAGCFE